MSATTAGTAVVALAEAEAEAVEPFLLHGRVITFASNMDRQIARVARVVVDAGAYRDPGEGWTTNRGPLPDEQRRLLDDRDALAMELARPGVRLAICFVCGRVELISTKTGASQRKCALTPGCSGKTVKLTAHSADLPSAEAETALTDSDAPDDVSDVSALGAGAAQPPDDTTRQP